MDNYLSFFVRIWQESQSESYQGEVLFIQSGEVHSFNDRETLLEFIRQIDFKLEGVPSSKEDKRSEE